MQKNYSVIFSLIFMVSFNGCEKLPTSPETTGSINGRVINLTTGNALSGVAISTNPRTSTIVTGSDGFFSLTDLDPDQYTILAQKDGYNDNSVTVTVVPGDETVADITLKEKSPELELTLSSLNFGTASGQETLGIKNKGIGTVNWSIEENLGWLQVSPASGDVTTETDYVTVSINRAGLAYGNHPESIMVRSNGGDLSVDIMMVVQNPDAPQLTVNQAILDFDSTKTNLDFTISNTGTGDLTWTISADKSWISLNPTVGTNDGSVTVTVQGQSLGTGQHTGKITINSNGGLIDITVRLYIPDSGGQAIPAPVLEAPYNITENSITLAWSIINHDQFQEYRLYRSTSPGVSETSNLVTTITNAYQNTYNDTGLEDGITFYYRVYSVNNYGVSFGSNEVSATTVYGIGSWGLVKTFDSDVVLNTIYAFSDADIWVAGIKNANSIIYRYVNGSWVETTPPDIGEILDMDFSLTNDGWAVCDGGVLHYDGAIWSNYASIPDALDVDANAPNDVWFIGPNDGYHLTQSVSEIGLYGYAIDVSENGQYGILISHSHNTSNQALIYEYNGFSWTQVTTLFADNTYFDRKSAAVQVVSQGNYFIKLGHQVAYPDKIIHYNGTSWETIIGGVPGDHLGGGMYAQSSARLWWSGESRDVYLWDGTSPYSEFFSTGGIINDIHFFEPQTGWACGSNKVYRYK